MDDPGGEIVATSSDTEFPFHSKSGKEDCAENAVLTWNGRFWGIIAVNCWMKVKGACALIARGPELLHKACSEWRGLGIGKNSQLFRGKEKEN